MEFGTQIINPIVSSLFVGIKTHIGFFVSASDHNREMHTKLRKLGRVAHDMNTRQKANNPDSLVVPDDVSDWLAKVEKLKAQGNSIPIYGVGCWNIKTRYKVGKKSFDIIMEIERLMNEKPEEAVECVVVSK